jgi:hypothetical protein
MEKFRSDHRHKKRILRELSMEIERKIQDSEERERKESIEKRER